MVGQKPKSVRVSIALAFLSGTVFVVAFITFLILSLISGIYPVF
jgi:hypothetical protein